MAQAELLQTVAGVRAADLGRTGLHAVDGPVSVAELLDFLPDTSSTTPSSWPSNFGDRSCRTGHDRTAGDLQNAAAVDATNVGPAVNRLRRRAQLRDAAAPLVGRPDLLDVAGGAWGRQGSLGISGCLCQRLPVFQPFHDRGLSDWRATFRPCPGSRAHRVPLPQREKPVGRLPLRRAQVPPRTQLILWILAAKTSTSELSLR